MSAAGSGSGQRAGDGPGGANSSHRALLYRQSHELARAAGAFVREGLAAGEPVLAALPGEKLAWTRSEVTDASAVEFVDANAFYRHRGHAARFLIDWLRAHAREPRRARVITEPPLAGQAPAQVTDYLRTEAAANLLSIASSLSRSYAPTTPQPCPRTSWQTLSEPIPNSCTMAG